MVACLLLLKAESLLVSETCRSSLVVEVLQLRTAAEATCSSKAGTFFEAGPLWAQRPSKPLRTQSLETPHLSKTFAEDRAESPPQPARALWGTTPLKTSPRVRWSI